MNRTHRFVDAIHYCGLILLDALAALHKLLNDKNEHVRKAAKEKLTSAH